MIKVLAPVRGARPLALVSVCFLASCAVFLARPGELARDRIKVPHAKHTKADVECIACHEEVYDAETLGLANVRPPEDKCLECHDKEKKAGKCDMCHTDVKTATKWAAHETDKKFSHAKHIDLVDEDCTRCHKDLPEPGRTSGPTTTMDSCNSCHEHEKQYVDGMCETCHKDLTKFALAPITLFSHQGDFLTDHIAPARAAAASCAQCHEQTFCADCHARTAPMKAMARMPDRVDRNFIHRNDFLTRHAMEAKAGPATCSRCHGPSFCVDCHQTENLVVTSVDPRNPHPASWSFPGAADTHGEEARRNITACAACHDQGAQSVCVKCHKVGGVGGNPHPDSWMRRHKSDDVQRNAVCVVCH